MYFTRCLRIAISGLIGAKLLVPMAVCQGENHYCQIPGSRQFFRISLNKDSLIGSWKMPGDTADYALTLCGNAFCAVGPNTAFITETDNINHAALTNKTPSLYRYIAFNSDTSFTIPRWASYYRVWRNAMATTPLHRTQINRLSGQLVIKQGTTWRLHHQVIEWPIEDYHWVEQVK